MSEIYVSLSTFAKEVGVSRAAITQSIKRCQERGEPLRVKLVEINGKQKVVFGESKKLWQESSSIISDDDVLMKKSKEKKVTEKKELISNIESNNSFTEEIDLQHPDNYQMSDIKKYKEYFMAKRQQMALQKSKGKLVDRDIIGKVLPALLSSFSDKLRYIPESTSFVIASRIKEAYDINVDEDELSLLVKNAMQDHLKSTVEFLKDNIKLELQES